MFTFFNNTIKTDIALKNVHFSKVGPECFMSVRVYLRSVEARNIDWHREYDSGGLLGGDPGQGLQISQLKGVWRLLDHLRSHLERPRGLLLTLSSNDLSLTSYHYHYHHCHHESDLLIKDT